VRERLVTRDDDARRLVYSLLGDTVRPEHDDAVMHIVPDGPQRCRFAKSRDMLPAELSSPPSDFMERSCPMIKHALEHRADAFPSVNPIKRPSPQARPVVCAGHLDHPVGQQRVPFAADVVRLIRLATSASSQTGVDKRVAQGDVRSALRALEVLQLSVDVG
jgi:hypothetical protein